MTERKEVTVFLSRFLVRWKIVRELRQRDALVNSGCFQFKWQSLLHHFRDEIGRNLIIYLSRNASAPKTISTVCVTEALEKRPLPWLQLISTFLTKLDKRFILIDASARDITPCFQLYWLSSLKFEFAHKEFEPENWKERLFVSVTLLTVNWQHILRSKFLFASKHDLHKFLFDYSNYVYLSS